MGCFVYVIGCECAAGLRTYVGWTKDLDRRLAQHNAGTGAKSTRGRVWALLYAERHASAREAMSREWHLKRDRTFRAKLRAAQLAGGTKEAHLGFRRRCAARRAHGERALSHCRT